MRKKIYEFTQYTAPDGEVYRFNIHDQFVLSETGMGMPIVRPISQSGPLQHGETIYDYRLEPRTIQLIMRAGGCSRDAYWENRAKLLNYMRINRFSGDNLALGTLRKTLSDGSKRDIDVMLSFGPVFQPRDPSKWDEWGFTETLRFIAPDPTFYDPTQIEQSWTLSGGSFSTELIYPYSLPIAYGDNSDNSIGVSYQGTWLSYPTITLTGPMSGCLIENDATGEKIRMNYSIGKDETVEIVLEYGNKTAISNRFGSVIGTISEDSDLATFHIAPAPEALNGSNNLSIVAPGTSPNTSRAKIEYYTRYIGI